MIRYLKKLFPGAKQKSTVPREILDFMAVHEIRFYGFGGLSINRWVASDFGYLIRYLTDKEIDALSDFRLISDQSSMIHQRINGELSKDVLRESEVFGYSREITEGNLIRLRGVIETIVKYTALCDRLGVDIYEARREDEKGLSIA